MSTSMADATGDGDKYVTAIPATKEADLVRDAMARGDVDGAFANIPNEILVQIFDHIDNDEQIYALALVSRRLHHAALPVYLARKACGARPADQLITSNYNALDAFRAIRVALFRPVLARLYFAMDCRKTDEELGTEIAALAGALGKLAALREMVLSFQNTGSVPVVATEGYGFPGGLRSASLAVLLDAVSGARCHSLVIRHCGSQSAALSFLGTSIEQEHRAMCLPVQAIKRAVGSILPLSVPLAKNTSLTTFHLHSPMALHPYLYRWMLDTLNNSPIDTLSISQQQCTSAQTWATVLPHIRIPTLTDLSLDFASIDISTLFAFASRHPYIKRLHIARYFTQPTALVAPRLPSGIFSTLTHLTAPVPWLNYLLSAPTSLPALNSARALIYVRPPGRIDLTAIEASLQEAMPRLSTLKELWLTLTVGAAPSDWMFSSKPAPSVSAQTSLLSLVVRMDISIKLYILPPALVSRLPSWLAQFPQLRHFELLMLSEKESSNDVLILTRAIGLACPRIDSVKFGLICDASPQ